MQRRDRRLELVGPGPARRERALEHAQAGTDPPLVPARAVLLVEGDVVPARVDARRAAGVVEEHQREQPEHLSVVGHQPAEEEAEADRLAAQLSADQALAPGRRVTLVEDQIHDAQDPP